MNKVLEYIIRAKDATGGAISSALSKLKGFASTVGRNLVNIQAAFTMLGSVARSAMAKLDKAFKFETMTVQFKRLVGGMDEAREHMAMLQRMGDTPPFSLEQFAAASRSLMVMTDGALGFQRSLELVGDAAAATGQPIENLAHEVGRAYAIIRDGQPLTRATMGLRNMGAITPEVAARLDELQKAGASNEEVWSALVKELEKFKGAMADTEKTGEGLIGAISSQWDDAVRTFGGAVLETAKDGLGLLLSKMRELNEDGTIEAWATKVGDAVNKVVDALKAAFGWFGKVKSAYEWARDGLEIIGSGVGSAVGTLMGGGSMSQAADAFTKGMAEMSQEQDDRKTDEARTAAKAADERKRKAATEAKKEAEGRAKEEDRVRRQMAEARQNAENRAARERAEFEKSLADDIVKAELDAEEKRAFAQMSNHEDFATRRMELAEDYLAKLKEVTSKAQKAELDAANSLANARIDMEERIAKERKRLLVEEVREREKARNDELDAQEEALKKRLDAAKKGIERTRKGMAADELHKTGIFGPYEYGGRANGEENFTDWQRAQRFSGRADRDAEKAARRDARAQEKYDRIKGQMDTGKKVSDADKRFAEDFEGFQEQKDGAKKIQDAMEAVQKERDQLQKDIKKTLDDIDKNIKDALGVG